jgi:DNA invertase Pin-like site-specific DNA recombinase
LEVTAMVNGKPICGYVRVSTDKQGKSGLGIEAQEQALRTLAQEYAGKIIKTYVEVEHGDDDNRPELARAIAHAKRSGAILAIAKLDRLARSVAFTANLMDSGVEFVACDNPHANRLTLHILSAVAEDELRRIRERTKAALAAYKARGGLLGASLPQCRNLTQAARERGAKAAGEAVSRLANEAYADLLPTMLEWRQAGLSQQAIADKLNEQGHTTRRGKPWNQVQVLRVLQRA